LFAQLIENYEGISVMSASDDCDISASSSAAVPCAVLGQLTPTAELDVAQESLAGRVFVVTDKSHADVLEVR